MDQREEKPMEKKLIKRLKQRRHGEKDKKKDGEGRTRVSLKGKKQAFLAGQRETEHVSVVFVGVEIRLEESAGYFAHGLGTSPVHAEPIKEIGGDEWAYGTCYSEKMQARKKAAGCTWFQAAIMFHGLEQVKRWTIHIAMVGIHKMLDQIPEGRLGVAFGHFPDMSQYAAWGFSGFPALDATENGIPGGSEQVEELGGYEYRLYDDGSIEVARLYAPYSDAELEGVELPTV